MPRRLLLLAGLLAIGLAPAAAAVSLRSRFPGNGATRVCPDAPLRLVFDGPVRLGRAGRIVITDAQGAVVDTIDLAAVTPKKLVGGFPLRYQPVTVTENTVTVRPHFVLADGRRYLVSIEPDVLAGSDGTPWTGLADTWSFATRSQPPAANAATLTVAADGSGDFCTVQGAIDFLPPGRSGSTVIWVRRGVYGELVDIPASKPRITLRGEDRHQSIIACANNAVLNPQHRAMMGVQADDVTIQNLTLRNLTPKGGKQAEALQVRGDHCVLVDDDFASFQDTLRLDGRVYVKNCAIAGDVDFIWGAGTVFFDQCAIQALNNGFLVQSRNGAQRLGYVFADCTIETAPGLTHVVLGRIDPRIYPSSSVAFLRCRMGPGILPEGWELDRGTDRAQTALGGAGPAATRRSVTGSALVDNSQPGPQLRFWEYGSADLAGRPLAVDRRLPFSRQLTAAEAAPLSDPATVLGGWAPALP